MLADRNVSLITGASVQRVELEGGVSSGGKEGGKEAAKRLVQLKMADGSPEQVCFCLCNCVYGCV